MTLTCKWKRDPPFKLNREIQVTKKQSGVTCLRVRKFSAADSEETGMSKMPANEPKCVTLGRVVYSKRSEQTTSKMKLNIRDLPEKPDRLKQKNKQSYKSWNLRRRLHRRVQKGFLSVYSFLQ